MKKVYLKPFDVFEVLSKRFVIRIRTLFSDEISAEEYEWLRSLKGSYEAEVTEEQAKRLEALMLASKTPVSRESELERDRELWEKCRDNCVFDTLELMVAQACNMRCEYCYGSDGSYSAPGIMTRETAFAALDWLKKETDGRLDSEREISVVFFGGEPLLNFEVIRAGTEYAETLFDKKRLKFGMTTNLTLMTDEMLDFFAEHNFGIMVSFDGARKYQKRRALNDGRDSFDVMLPLIKRTLKKIKRCAARATIHSTDDREAVVRGIKAAGFTEYQICGVSGNMGEEITRNDLFEDYLWRAAMLKTSSLAFVSAVKARDEKAVKAAIKNDEFEYFARSSLNCLKTPKRFIACGSGRSMAAVSCEGDLYPCHRFTGREEFCIGSVYKGVRHTDFDRNVILENPRCRECFIRYACGGPCAHVCACDVSGQEEQPPIFRVPESHCVLEKTRIMLKAYLNSEIKDEDRSWLGENALMELKSEMAAML